MVSGDSVLPFVSNACIDERGDSTYLLSNCYDIITRVSLSDYDQDQRAHTHELVGKHSFGKYLSNGINKDKNVYGGNHCSKMLQL
jgi:hypothetical protein